jgi:hypothetical protein
MKHLSKCHPPSQWGHLPFSCHAVGNMDWALKV